MSCRSGERLGILPFYQYESDACGGKNEEKREKERVKGNKPYTNTHIQVSFISMKAMHVVGQAMKGMKRDG